MAKRGQKHRSNATSRRASTQSSQGSGDTIERIAAALERLAPAAPAALPFAAADAFSWHPDQRRLLPVARVNRVDMFLLKGIDRVRDVLVENPDRLAPRLPPTHPL